MAIQLKSPHHVAHLREAGRLVAETFEMLRPHVVPGVTTADLDRLAEEYIRGRGARPIYKGYRGGSGWSGRATLPPFPGTICASVNDVICHGIPTDQALNEGDIIGIDIGVVYKGWVGDACYTFPVGQASPAVLRHLETARECLERGIRAARGGAHLGDIGAAVQRHAEARGYTVVREYGGHGVGRSLHEDPFVPHIGKPGTGLRLEPGMVFTIEPMINVGRPEFKLMPDRWTVRTQDGSNSAQFEHTVAITDGDPLILTLP